MALVRNSTMQHKVLAIAMGLGLLGGLGLLPIRTPWLQSAMAQSQPEQDSMPAMTVEQLEAILQREADVVQGGDGQWEVTLGDRNLLVLANLPSNRMRILTPVAPVTELSVEQVQSILLANFHTTLDARYAVTEGTVVSLYVHPLQSLQANDLRSALRQVASLAETFGSSYSSGELLFDQNAPTPSEPATAVEAQRLL